MKTPKNVTKNVTSHHIIWQPPQFTVSWADHPAGVPELDPSRINSLELPAVGEFTANHYAASRNPTEPPALTERNYPRLVRSFPEAGSSPPSQVDSRRLLKDLARLYKTVLADDGSQAKTRAAVQVLAATYSPFAVFRTHDLSWDGLSLHAWVDVAFEIAIWLEFIGKLNERLTLSDTASWLERAVSQARLAKNLGPASAASRRLAKLLHLQRAYGDFVVSEPTKGPTSPAQQQHELSSHAAIRRQAGADLQNRLGRHSCSLVTIPGGQTASEAFHTRVVCEVGIFEWASFLLAQTIKWNFLMRVCPFCGAVFEARRPDRKFCSGRCRTANSRRNKASA